MGSRTVQNLLSGKLTSVFVGGDIELGVAEPTQVTSNAGNMEGGSNRRDVGTSEQNNQQDGSQNEEEEEQGGKKEQDGGRKERDSPKDQGDPCEQVFSLYVAKAEEFDKTLVESWKDDMDSILIFAGLFSATVTAFIIESYRTLQPNPADRTLTILVAMSHQLAALSNSTLPNIPSPSPDQMPFEATSSTLRVNAYWFLSLAFSLMCALGATLVKQWGRNYLQEIRRHPAAYKRARIRTFLFNGLETFRMPVLVNAVTTSLHASLLLFFIGLVEFIRPMNGLLALILVGSFGVGVVLYAATIVLPSYNLQCPYQTPMAHLWWIVVRLFRLPLSSPTSRLWGIFAPLFRFTLWYMMRLLGYITWVYPLWIIFGDSTTRLLNRFFNFLLLVIQYDLVAARENAAMEKSHTRFARDSWALQWTMEQLNEDHELEPFLRGLPGFIQSSKVDGHDLLFGLLRVGLEDRIFKMMHSSDNSRTTEVQYKGVAACMDAIQLSSPILEDGSRFLSILRKFSTVPKQSIATQARCILPILTYHELAFRNLRDIHLYGQDLPIMHLDIMQPLVLRTRSRSPSFPPPRSRRFRSPRSQQIQLSGMEEIILVLLIQVAYQVYLQPRPDQLLLPALEHILDHVILSKLGPQRPISYEPMPVASVRSSTMNAPMLNDQPFRSSPQPSLSSMGVLDEHVVRSFAHPSSAGGAVPASMTNDQPFFSQPATSIYDPVLHLKQMVTNKPHPINDDVCDIINQIAQMLKTPTWCIMVKNILEGKDPNDCVPPLAPPSVTRSSWYPSTPPRSHGPSSHHLPAELDSVDAPPSLPTTHSNSHYDAGHDIEYEVGEVHLADEDELPVH